MQLLFLYDRLVGIDLHIERWSFVTNQLFTVVVQHLHGVFCVRVSRFGIEVYTLQYINETPKEAKAFVFVRITKG